MDINSSPLIKENNLDEQMIKAYIGKKVDVMYDKTVNSEVKKSFVENLKSISIWGALLGPVY